MKEIDKRIEKGKIISFKYKGGRRVRGEVVSVNNSGVLIMLHTDYIGKNQEWYKGEQKQFNISEIKL